MYVGWLVVLLTPASENKLLALHGATRNSTFSHCHIFAHGLHTELSERSPSPAKHAPATPATGTFWKFWTTTPTPYSTLTPQENLHGGTDC